MLRCRCQQEKSQQLPQDTGSRVQCEQRGESTCRFSCCLLLLRYRQCCCSCLPQLPTLLLPLRWCTCCPMRSLSCANQPSPAQCHGGSASASTSHAQGAAGANARDHLAPHAQQRPLWVLVLLPLLPLLLLLLLPLPPPPLLPPPLPLPLPPPPLLPPPLPLPPLPPPLAPPHTRHTCSGACCGRCACGSTAARAGALALALAAAAATAWIW